jgi:hypothetical protein
MSVLILTEEQIEKLQSLLVDEPVGGLSRRFAPPVSFALCGSDNR